jgi:hypothetical protein
LKESPPTLSTPFWISTGSAPAMYRTVSTMWIPSFQSVVVTLGTRRSSVSGDSRELSFFGAP